jgi:hypothetical protein
MDAGNYNGNGYRPAGYSGHERWLMGWLTPEELKETKSITGMPALANEGRVYFIRNDGQKNEYYFIENRQQTSWDTSLPGSGILIFHIDYDPDLWCGVSDFANKPSRRHYELFHANNSNSSVAKWAYPYLSNDSLTNNSKPAATLYNENTDSTKLMNKAVRDIAVARGLASFEFMVPPVTAIREQRTAVGKPVILYDLGSILIIRETDGTIKKVMKH